MQTRPQAARRDSPRFGVGRPTLASLFFGFVSIGMMSFGGGLAAWTRREVVQNRRWLDEQQFISGYALSQLVPGATNINLAVFIGTQLRGVPGALAAFAGLNALPIAIVLIAGALYFHTQGGPAGAWFSAGLSGMGAVAIGMNLGLGVQLARVNIRRLGPALVAVAVALGIGVARLPLVSVLAVMVPISLLVAWLGRQR